MKRYLLMMCAAALAIVSVSAEEVFVSDFGLQAWTAIDANGDGNTWTLTTDRYTYNGMSADTADDYLLSPAFSVTAGTDYEVTLQMKQTSAFEEDNIEVFAVNGDETDAPTGSALATFKIYGVGGTGIATRHVRLCATASRQMRIAVRVHNSQANGTMALKALTVRTVAKATPMAVTHLRTTADPAAQTVRLAWLNPCKDTQGMAIVQPLGVKIYANGTQIASLDNREVGKADSYTFAPSSWSGNVTYSVAAVVGGNESARTDTIINLDDNKGEEKLVKSFAKFTKNDIAAYWYTESVAGSSVWGWGYLNTIMFDYKLGQKDDDWLITPEVALEAGKRYMVKYKLQTNERYGATIYVTLGNTQRPASHTRVINEHVNLLCLMSEHQTPQFTVEAADNYYIGFHLTAAEVAVHLQQIEIYEVQTSGGTTEPDEPDVPQHEPEYTGYDEGASDTLPTPTVTAFDPNARVVLGTEGVDMMMAAKYAMIDLQTYTTITEGYYRMTQETGYQPNPSATLRRAYVGGGACYHDGLIYSNEFTDTEREDLQEPLWRIYDARTFELVSEHRLPNNCRATTSCLTYDVTNDKIYGFNYTYTETYLVEVDPTTGQMERKGDFYDRNLKFLAIASRKDGTLYCIYMDKSTTTHYLARVRKSDGRLATIGVLRCGGYMDGDPFVNGGYQQCAWFCNANDKLYWLHQSASNHVAHDDYTPIMEIDVDSSFASLAAYLPTHYITGGVFFVEPRFTAPAAVQSFDFVPTNADHTQGHLEVTAPSTDYIGRQLTDKVRVVVMDVTDPDDQSEMMSVVVNPGEVAMSETLELNEGTIKVEVFAFNAEGEEGVHLRRQFYAGYDELKAPSNITLTADGLTTTLTWDAPTEGVHGNVVNLDNITYKVVRYPGEVTVAEGISERRFVETHPSDMTRYVYAVSSIDAEGVAGPSDFSNNLIVGTPLTIPFGGAFTSAADLFNYYTIVDSNGDNCTWTYDNSSQQAIYVYNETQSADDWLIAPPAIYEAGVHYELTFTARSSMADYPEAFEVCWGGGRTPAECDLNLLSVEAVPTTATRYAVKLPVVDETGVYYFAIHCTSPVFHEYLYVNNIRVEETADLSNPHPTRDEIVGDYVVMNYLSYEGSTLYLKDTRDFTIEADPESDNGVILTNFYIKQADPFKATYNPVNGSLVIASGTTVFEFNDGTGASQMLYAWDSNSQNITSANIIFREDADKGWTCSTHTVLMVGTSPEDYQPYEFAERSVVRRANATTSSQSFIYDWSSFTGQLEVSAEYNEQHPSYVERNGHAVTVYNLHPVDVYGYGITIELAYDEQSGNVATYPFICGEMQSSYEYPYKALAGTNLGANNIPIGAYAAGTNQEGWITGRVDELMGTITLNPASIYPVAYDYNTGNMSIEYRSVYETIKQFVIKYDLGALHDGIVAPECDDTAADVLTTEYYTLAGQRITAPLHGQLVIRRTTHADGTTRSVKLRY